MPHDQTCLETSLSYTMSLPSGKRGISGMRNFGPSATVGVGLPFFPTLLIHQVPSVQCVLPCTAGTLPTIGMYL